MAQSAHLVPDTVRTQTVDDLAETVDYDSSSLVAGAYAHMTFHLTKAGTDQPVTDLQTYLGAFGHMLIMSEDMRSYVHSHPVEVTNLSAVLDGDPPEFLIPPGADLEKI